MTAWRNVGYPLLTILQEVLPPELALATIASLDAFTILLSANGMAPLLLPWPIQATARVAARCSLPRTYLITIGRRRTCVVCVYRTYDEQSRYQWCPIHKLSIMLFCVGITMQWHCPTPPSIAEVCDRLMTGRLMSQNCHIHNMTTVVRQLDPQSRARMSTPNPLHLANTAQQMARTAPASDAVVFNRMAMICMGVMAAASVAQVFQSLLRDLNRKHAGEAGRTHGRSR